MSQHPITDPGAMGLRPHRATMLLVFSILSWVVCVIFGICAYFMAKSDLAEMDAGRMDPSGRSTTNAAKIVAMIHLIVAAVSIVLSLLVFILMFVLAAASAAGGP